MKLTGLSLKLLTTPLIISKQTDLSSVVESRRLGRNTTTQRGIYKPIQFSFHLSSDVNLSTINPLFTLIFSRAQSAMASAVLAPSCLQKTFLSFGPTYMESYLLGSSRFVGILSVQKFDRIADLCLRQFWQPLFLLSLWWPTLPILVEVICSARTKEHIVPTAKHLLNHRLLALGCLCLVLLHPLQMVQCTHHHLFYRNSKRLKQLSTTISSSYVEMIQIRTLYIIFKISKFQNFYVDQKRSKSSQTLKINTGIYL